MSVTLCLTSGVTGISFVEAGGHSCCVLKKTADGKPSGKPPAQGPVTPLSKGEKSFPRCCLTLPGSKDPLKILRGSPLEQALKGLELALWIPSFAWKVTKSLASHAIRGEYPTNTHAWLIHSQPTLAPPQV